VDIELSAFTLSCWLVQHLSSQQEGFPIPKAFWRKDVLDLLSDIKDIVGKEKEIQIISGYRSIAYNELLISQGRNVSRNTLHLQGLAIDFSIEGVSNKGLSRIAKSFSAGGVGKYPEFVHIDVGRVRYW
jgi:uncharacterized protein YcbK (DUF882 family)